MNAIHKKDKVLVLSGRSRGKQGEVVKVLREDRARADFQDQFCEAAFASPPRRRRAASGKRKRPFICPM